MPANGQASAGAQLSNLFGGLNQKLNALNQPATNVRGGDAEAQAGGFYGAAPANAAAAPTKGAGNSFTGLCEALNQHQQTLVKKGTYEIADEYAIVFAPPAIGASQVTKPGDVTYKNTAPKAVDTTAAKLDNNTDSVNTNSQMWQVLAGTQIVQLIDQVMRSSRYITDQQTVNIDADGKETKNTTANTKGVTAWYKISVSATQLGYDKKRRDNAYRMTFTITPYAINQMISPYFPASTYRGAHKAYNYWFTGLNTQILNYEQQYNQAFYTTMNATPSALAIAPPTGRDQTKQTYMATSEQRGQGQANAVNVPADNAAAFLYSVSDFAEVQMKIIGDPAWMQQGEVSVGVNAKTFDFKPFNPDGTINFDSQEVTFTVSFNRPTDYNFSTGIMNTNSGSGAPQETFAYIAKSCKNVFSKGVFTQELVGSLLPLANSPNTGAAANARPAPVAATTDSRTSAKQIVAEQDASFNYGTTDGSEQTRMLAEQDAGFNDPPTPQPASPPKPATSSGDINQFSFGSLANNISSGVTAFNNNLTTQLTGLNKPPQNMNKDE